MPTSNTDHNAPSETQIGNLTQQEVDTSPFFDVYQAFENDPTYKAVRENYNDKDIVTLGANDMHVHIQHGERGVMPEIPRVTGTSGSLFMDSCNVDKEKAQAIANFVTDIPDDDGTQKGIGVYHANGTEVTASSYFENFQDYALASEDTRPILRTFRDGTSDYGEDMELVNNKGKKLIFERNPYCNKVYISDGNNDILNKTKEHENQQATSALDSMLFPFYVQFYRGEISEGDLDKKIDTMAKKLGIVNESFIANFKVGITQKAEALGQQPLFPIECDSPEGAQRYLSKLHYNFCKGLYTPEDYEHITKAFVEQVPNGQKALASFQEQIPKLEKSFETHTQTAIVTAITKQYEVNDLEKNFINNSLEKAIDHDIEVKLDLNEIYEPKLRDRLRKNIRKEIHTQLHEKFEAQFKQEQESNQFYLGLIDQGLGDNLLELGKKGTMLYAKTENIRKQWLTGKIDDNQYKDKLKDAISGHEVPTPDGKRKFTETEVNEYMRVTFAFSVKNKDLEKKQLHKEFEAQFKQEQESNQFYLSVIDQGFDNNLVELGEQGTMLYEKTKDIRKQWLAGKIDDNQYKNKLKDVISQHEIPTPDGKRKFTEAEVNNYMRVVFAFSVKNKGIKVEHPQQEAKKEKTGRLERVRRFIKKLKGSNKDLNTPNPFDNKSNRDKDVDNLAVFRNESVRDKVIESLKEFREKKITAKELVGRLNTLVSPSENTLEQNAFHNFLERQLSPEQYKEVKKLGVIALYRPLPRTLTTEDLSGMSTSTASRKSRTRNLFNRDTPKRKAKNRGQQNSRG